MEISLADRFLIVIASREGEHVPDNEVSIRAIASTYYALHDNGCDVTLVSRSGGAPGVSNAHRSSDKDHPDVIRFSSDRFARDELAETLSLSDTVADDFSAALCIGFSGRLSEDENADIADLVSGFSRLGRPVAFVPGNSMHFSPDDATNGMIVIAGGAQYASSAAHALMAVVKQEAAQRVA
jgi:hypothetical protein